MKSQHSITRPWLTATLSLLLTDAVAGCHGGETIYGGRDGSMEAGQAGKFAGIGGRSTISNSSPIPEQGGNSNQSNGGAGGSEVGPTNIGKGGVTATVIGSTTASGGNASTGGTSATPQGGSTIGVSGAAAGGAAAGGAAAGGAAAGGAAAGGAAAGGAAAGGAAAGGAPTGGANAGGAPPSPNKLVISEPGTYWKTDGTWTEVTSGTADVIVNDSSTVQTWDGFGGAFNEMGWVVLTSTALQDEAMNLLFGIDGAHFSWGRIPMGASDYATSRYTLDDPSTPDPVANGETARPPGDTALGKFSLARDEQKLIPFIKAAQAVRSDLKFWASPWTPPVWMKAGYKKDGWDNGNHVSAANATKPSYFDGGNMSGGTGDANLKAYAQYFAKFVQGYKDRGINIEVVSPQNEPGYEQNYPSCLWDSATYISFVGKYLGPAMQPLGVKLMLGTMSNNDITASPRRLDTDIADAVLKDATAKSFLTVAGAQWGVLGKVVSEKYSFGGLPIWATEHKCGNYPWERDTYKATAPNDLAYAVESWGYIRDAITKGKVTAYNAWNMVLDNVGKGNDTSRDWAQNALLTVSSGKLTKTPTYWVFRHISQYAAPGGKVVGTTGSGVDSIGFKNPDGSLVAVIYNSGAAKSAFTVAIGGKKLQFSMPSAAWATVYWHS